MFVIILIAALAIDVAAWYQKHHSAQVAADASALAAANCLANSSAANTSPNTCTSTSDTNADTVATTIAGTNGYTLSDAGNVQLGFDSVTVTVPTTSPALFAGIANLVNARISARAVATYHSAGEQFSCTSAGSNSCISFFAANPNCPGSSTNTTVGLVLVVNDNGGGQSSIPDAYSNGYVFDGANSASSKFTITVPGSKGNPTCSSTNTKGKGETLNYTAAAVPYPVVWPLPTSSYCTKTADYFSTQSGTPAAEQITTPGIYCVTNGGAIATSATPSCQSATGAMTSGYIYLDEAASSLSAGGTYEFVSPCTIVSNSGAPRISNIPGQPLIYGTSNITAAATGSSLPTCTDASNNGTAGSDLFLEGNNEQITSPIYDQCGTIEITQNNAFLGYLEAWNIIVDKNNTASGNGPTSPGGGGVTVLQAGDSLSG